ncbi:TadE/TadG family type IV pilus assembly protein [Polaromonas sp. JS666]|uniref:TadE/TadG family type IV pilus assembly protein n=1 Tax=Polaromonas sp. (strain JS666 / ATCC BAA-500) TaxID=296591 RepID=UPI0000531F78|nr:TadE family protein [Polaromonas sp. JS666]ABE44469.1 TadE-like protein [Polaromonas sp. JS666]
MRTSPPPKHPSAHRSPFKRQGGVAAVEFAIISLLFFTILFAILEFGRMLYVYNTMQEVTRRAAREAVVRWTNQESAVKSLALFGGTSLPAGAEVTSGNISISYLTKSGAAVNPPPLSPGDNISACGDADRAPISCIYSVRVSIENVTYSPMVSLFSFLNIGLPTSVVTMHAESMGFNGN